MSVYEFDIQRPFSAPDNLMQLWKEVLIPIFLGSKQSTERVEGIGTAFILERNERYFLVTALHVLTAIMESPKGAYMSINGKAAAVEKLWFRKSDSHDLAVAGLSPEWCDEHDIKKVKAVMVSSEVRGKPFGRYMTMGFPATKNVLDLRYGKVNTSVLGISMRRLAEPVETKVADAIFLEHDHEDVYTTENELVQNHLRLHGMSGAPCFEIRETTRLVEGEVMRHLFPEVVGVLVEWHKEKKTLVVAPMRHVCDLADWFLAKLPS